VSDIDKTDNRYAGEAARGGAVSFLLLLRLRPGSSFEGEMGDDFERELTRQQSSGLGIGGI